MKYYLDTSAIYQLRKIPERILAESFYSSLTVIELIGGLNAESFQKRKVILSMLKASPAVRDNTFPDQLIFEAFDSFNRYDYVEQRANDLFGLMADVLMVSDYDQFWEIQVSKNRKFDFDYFVWLDNFLTDNFYKASIKGSQEIRAALNDAKGKASVELNGERYDLSSRRAIVNFLNAPLVNDSFTILALANLGIQIFSTSFKEVSEECIYQTYNGKLKHFLTAMSAYSIDQIINDKTARRNDSQDLFHLLYLRSSPSVKILSEDSIFSLCIPEHTVTIQSLTD